MIPNYHLGSKFNYFDYEKCAKDSVNFSIVFVTSVTK